MGGWQADCCGDEWCESQNAAGHVSIGSGRALCPMAAHSLSRQLFLVCRQLAPSSTGRPITEKAWVCVPPSPD